MCEQASQIKNGLQDPFFSAAHARARAHTPTLKHTFALSSPRGSSFAASASSPIISLLIESQQLMAAFTPQLPVIAAPPPPTPPSVSLPPRSTVLCPCGSRGRLPLLGRRPREPIGCFVAGNRTDGAPRFPL